MLLADSRDTLWREQKSKTNTERNENTNQRQGANKPTDDSQSGSSDPFRDCKEAPGSNPARHLRHPRHQGCDTADETNYR